MIQAQYDAAVKNPPWQDTNTLEIDDRPKKKRKLWYYEVVAPDGKVVDVIDEEECRQGSEQDLSRSSRSRSTTSANSRSSTPTANSTAASSLSRVSSPKAEPLDEDAHQEDTQNTPSVDSRPVSRRSSRRIHGEDTSVDHSVTPDSNNHNSPSREQILPDESNSTSISSSATNSRPPSRASPLRRQSAANSLAASTITVAATVTTTTTKEPPLTRTRILQREESSVLTTRSEDEEPPGTQSSQASTRASLPNLKGRDLFDSMVWSDAFTTSIFYMFISSLRQKIQNEVNETTETHKFIKTLRDGGRLVRNYTQNIDSLEEREGLCTDLTRGPGNRARFHSKTQREPRPAEIDVESAHNSGVEVVLLHGSLVHLRCGICTKLSSWDEAERESATLAGQAPDCPSCTEYNARRTGSGRRGLAVGRLRPDIVLYGEEHPNANLVSPLITHDLGLGPDVLLIMGTSLKVHGLKIMVKEFAKAVHTRGGKVVFVNRTKPPESTWGDVIDYWVEWDCDAWVLDLKERRGDLWLPQGTIEEEPKRRESSGDAKQSLKKTSRPKATRDDQKSGVYLTFKILDQLGKFTDSKGQSATRFPYWVTSMRASTVSAVELEVARKPVPAKKACKSLPAPKTSQLPNTLPSKASKKRKSYPTCLRDDKKNAAFLVTQIWESLRRAIPSLSQTPPEITKSILQERCQNIPRTEQTFAFNSSSNHMPNVGGRSWGLDKINLITHPPSGASIPVHIPSPIERKPTNHSYSTRSSRRFSRAETVVETIVVDGGEAWQKHENDSTIVVGEVIAEKVVAEQAVAAPQAVENLVASQEITTGEAEINMPTPPGSDPLTPSSSRIKRMGSLGAILSVSPEDLISSSSPEEWHDAPEVLT